MRLNTINTEKDYNSILKQIKNGESTTWTLKPHKANIARSLSEIGDCWQNAIITKKLQTLSMVKETLDYMSSFVLCGEVEYSKYKNIIDHYLHNLLELDPDVIYEKSIESLSELGYKFKKKQLWKM